MNLILTQSCNKNCSFCFARSFRTDSSTESEMSLDMIARLLDTAVFTKDQEKRVSLLGGEPTQHPEFIKILKMCFDRGYKVLLVSNFLFSEEIRNAILGYLEDGKPMGFLANAMDLNDHFLQVFKDNYLAISKRNIVTWGITLSDALSSSSTLETYLLKLRAQLGKPHSIRISLNFPDADKENFYFINNHRLGDLVYYAVKEILFLDAVPLIDCVTFPCMYRSEEIRNFITQHAERGGKFICDQAPADYLPDGTIHYCFPAFSISVDQSEGLQVLQDKYQAKENAIAVPPECQMCQFYLDQKCAGPCLGFRNLS